MLSDGQVAHFESFGFLFIPQLFSAEETAEITATADNLWLKLRDGKPLDPEQGQGEGNFIEQDEALTKIVTDDRIYEAAESILGPGFVWAGVRRATSPSTPSTPGIPIVPAITTRSPIPVSSSTSTSTRSERRKRLSPRHSGVSPDAAPPRY